MAVAAFQSTDKVHYLGFDLFEDATAESDDYEMNTKAHNSIEAVRQRLTDFAEKMKAEGKSFTFKLYKGDTKKTLASL